jgi:hypothetical protein
MTADEESFLLVHQIDAYENEVRVFTHARTLRVPRDLV